MEEKDNEKVIIISAKDLIKEKCIISYIKSLTTGDMVSLVIEDPDRKLTDNMLYFYSEFFIQELHITEQELPGSNDGEKHANMRLATAYQYCYPGKK